MEADERRLLFGSELFFLGPPLRCKELTSVVLVIRKRGGRQNERYGQDIIDLAPKREEDQEVGEPLH
jgi:hypothetical protein